MKVLIAALALASAPALANWVSITSTPEDHVFANTQVRVHDGKPALWVRTDSRTGNGSVVMLMEFDCRARATRMISFTRYSMARGQGSVVSSSAAGGAWIPAPPGTAAEELVRSVCP